MRWSIEPSINTCNERGFIHSYEAGSTLDGPGLRFVVFMQGCPLRCLYCHNPDTREPHQGRSMTVKELIHELNKYHSFIDNGHGGLTVSGGEPLLQHHFVADFMAAAKKKGFHTALDTSGFTTRAAAEKVLPSTDLVLLDIKSWLPELYHKITHVPLEPTLDFAKLLSEKKMPTWIRFVLVPGLTDSRENIHGLARFCGTLKSLERIEILPFHKLGEHKWKLMGFNYELSKTQPPSPSQIEEAKSYFQTFVDCPVY